MARAHAQTTDPAAAPFRSIRAVNGCQNAAPKASQKKKSSADSLVGIIVRMMQGEIREDDLHALLAVAPEFVVAVHRRRIRRRIIGRRQRSVLGRVASEDLVARRT